jgi:hypothetical protein
MSVQGTEKVEKTWKTSRNCKKYDREGELEMNLKGQRYLKKKKKKKKTTTTTKDETVKVLLIG